MEPPSFSTNSPQTVTAVPGSDASIVLPLPSGSPPFQYEWSRAGAKLDDRFKPADDAGGVRLTISAASSGDSGVYTLQASNAAGKDTTRVQLEITPDEKPTGDDPPTFLRRLQDLTVKVGTRTRFLVEIVSSTECRVTWYRNERRLLEAERIALVRDGNFWCADISAVSVDDSGRWTCTAENIGGRASCSAHLNVLVPKAYKRPEFVEELRALLTEQGTVSLECKVVGVPTPVLRWFKDSREIKAGDVFALTANAEDPTSLGTYTCEAVNCMGRAYSSSKVHVIGRSSREGSARPVSGGVALEPPPIFTKELEDQFVRICEPLTLSCHIVVPPWPRSIVWYNKEGKIESSDKYRVLEDGVGGYLLEIPSAEWQDEGEWKCVATSSGGRIGISTCYVSMDVPKNYRKPRFMENLQAVLTEEGLVSFECKVVGFPTPVLSWFKDGQELKPGDVYQLTGTNSLGSYCCIARNCMGHASSSAELTVEDIQNQLNEEEKLQLFSKNQAPKFLQGLKSVEAKIDEPFRFTIKVAIPPEPTVLWYRDDQPVDESSRCHHGKEERGVFFIDIQSLEFMDQAEWKCVAMNDFGHSITSCFLKLIIPRHYKKPRFLENLQAILSDEGAVNLECKVIGVPQPVLKWYKDGEELKPGDIHRIISGQDGTCCLGTYTCEAQNCMGIAASSASLLGFEDSIKAKSKKNVDEQTLQRNLSLSTIHEERTSQMYDTPVGDITLDDKGEITYSFDGKEVSVSLYETPDLTEEEALQIVEMYADQLSENVTEHNVVELPPLRFVKETSTSGNLLMEAIIIDVSPEYFTSPEEDLRTEADIEDISIADENCPPQLSQDQEIDEAEDYLEKTMALLSDEKASFPKKTDRKKSDSQKSVDDYFSLSRDQSLSEEKKDDDTQGLSESDLQSFASARSSGKPKSKSSKPSIDDGQESSDITKTVLLKEDLQILNQQTELDSIIKNKRERRSRSSRRSSSGSEKSLSKMKEEALETNFENNLLLTNLDQQSSKEDINNICLSLAKLINDVQVIERDIILKSELMSTAATASRSLEIINSIIAPLSEIHSIAEAIKETVSDSLEVTTSLFNRLPQSLSNLYQSLTIVEKCIDVESENKTLVKKTCTIIIEKCGDDLNNLVEEINSLVNKGFQYLGDICVASIQTTTNDLNKTVTCSLAEIRESKKHSDRIDTNLDITTPELKHLQKTQKAVYELRNPLKSLLHIAKEVNISSFVTADHITNSQIILNDMSTPIQDLQSALEQIEYLSVTETQSDLQKYNTEIIETVMDPVIKLRTSFEQLSVEAGTMEKVDVLNEVLYDIKHNINEIAAHLDIFETKIGSFNILQSENKLEALQKMAQILINLENNLVILDIMPCLKIHMADFHKNLTKVLEHIIESNDAQKYFTFLEICDAVNRLNALIKNLDSKDILALAGIINNLKTVQANIEQNEFTPELNLSILSNITDLLINIQETINQADISTYSINSENVEDLSIRGFEEEKLNIVLEQIERAITTISNVVSLETTNNLVIKQAFDQIIPTLGELKCCVASLNVNVNEREDNISDLSSFTFAQAVANPLCELNLGISVLTQVLCEKASDGCEHSQLKVELATPLVELRNALEILQHDVISQNDEKVNDPKISSSVANAVQSIQSCIIMIQEPDLLENADEVSTLDDISAIKTTADMLFTDDLISPKIQEITTEINAENTLSASTECLKVLHNHIMVLQNPESMDALQALSKREENACIKTIIAQLETLHCAIEGILHPIKYEESQKRSYFPNSTQLITIFQPIQELLQSLSVIDISNMPAETKSQIDQIKLLSQNVSKLENCLRDSLDFINVAVKTSDGTLEISTKINTLKKLCEELKNNLDAAEKDAFIKCPELLILDDSVNTILNTISFSQEINIAQVKLSLEELQLSIAMAQDEIIEFAVDNPIKLHHETKILKSIDDIEKTISSLIQLRFIDIDEVFNCDNYVSQEVAKEVQHEKLKKIESVLEINGNLTQHLSQEMPNNILKSIENSVKAFNDELILFCCLFKQRLTPKRIIKMLQLFHDLCQNLKQCQSHQQHCHTSERLNEWMVNSEECLKHIQSFLIDILQSHSHFIFDIPISNIKTDELFLHTILETNENANMFDFVKLLISTIKSIKPCFQNIQADVLKELESYDVNSDAEDDTDKKFSILHEYLSEKIKTTNEQEFEAIFRVIKKYADCKRVRGVTKKIIFIKCISDCMNVLKSTFEGQLLTSNKNDLLNILLKLSEHVECFHKKILTVGNENVKCIEKNYISKDLEWIEPQLEAISNVSKNLEKCLECEHLSLENNYNRTLAKDLVNKIHLIKKCLQSIERKSTDQSEDIIIDMQPIKEIDRILSILLSKEFVVINEENRQLKERTDSLVHHMEHYIEIIEIVEEVSAVLKLDDLKKSADIARELRESVTSESSPDIIKSGPELNTRAEQKQLVQNLQEALTALNIEAFDCEQEFAPPLSDDIRQQIIEVASDIQNDLVALTSIFVVLENTETLANEAHTDESGFILIKEEKPGNLINNEQYAIIDLEVNQEQSSQVLGTDIASTNEESAILQIEEGHPIIEVFTTPSLEVSEDNKQSESELSIQEVEQKSGSENFVFKNQEEPVTEADTIEESLVQHINEYLCEDILMDLRKILPPENFDQLEQLASEVRDNAVSKYTRSLVHKQYLNKQLERVLTLQQAMVEAYNKNLGEAADQALIGKDSLQALKSVVHNLLKSLEMYVVLINSIVKTEGEFEDAEVFIEETPKISKETDINICMENISEAEDPSIATLIEKQRPEEQKIDSDNINFEVQRNEMNVLSENITDVVVKNSKADMDELKKDTIIEAEKSSAIHELETLLQEVNEMLSLKYPFDQTSEELQDTLEEVQTVIMKLKCDFDGSTNDFLNETIEDLECNVRSVQLQINESSPPALLKEACANLQSLVAGMKTIYNTQNKSQEITANHGLSVCTNNAEVSLELLDKISCLKDDGSLEGVILILNGIKDRMKSLKSCFSADAESLMVIGIQVQQNLDHVEDNVFALEKELEGHMKIDINFRDSIIAAIHSIYGSISNMRGTISSIQKKYMYDNYGQPSDSFLKAIKNVNHILKCDKKKDWKKFAKSLRKVLNHFEDIKFYINFDKTARLPSDSAFTKIILGELSTVLSEVVSRNISNLDNTLTDKLQEAVIHVGKILDTMENQTTLEVKEKIPIFKELSVKMFDLTNCIKTRITNNSDITDQFLIEHKVLTKSEDVEKLKPGSIKQDENEDQVHKSKDNILPPDESIDDTLKKSLETIQGEFKDTLHDTLKEIEKKGEYCQESEGEIIESEEVNTAEIQDIDSDKFQKDYEISSLELNNESEEMISKPTINETRNLIQESMLGTETKKNGLNEDITDQDNDSREALNDNLKDENETESNNVVIDFESRNINENISLQDTVETGKEFQIETLENAQSREEFSSVSSTEYQAGDLTGEIKNEEFTMESKQNDSLKEESTNQYKQELQNKNIVESIELTTKDESMQDKHDDLKQQLSTEVAQNFEKAEQIVIDYPMEYHTSLESLSIVSESVDIQEAQEEKNYSTREKPHVILMADFENENTKQNDVDIKEDIGATSLVHDDNTENTEAKIIHLNERDFDSVVLRIEENKNDHIQNTEILLTDKIEEIENDFIEDNMAKVENTKLSEFVALESRADIKEDMLEKTCKEIAELSFDRRSKSEDLEIITKKKDDSQVNLQDVVINELDVNGAATLKDFKNIKETETESDISSIQSEQTAPTYKIVPECEKIDNLSSSEENFIKEGNQEECQVTVNTRLSDINREGPLLEQTANPIEISQGTKDENKLILHESADIDTDKAENLKDDVSQAVSEKTQLDKGEKSTYKQAGSEGSEEHHNNELHISTDIDVTSQDNQTANPIEICQGTKDENKLILHESADIDTNKAENLKDDLSQAVSEEKQLDKGEKSTYKQAGSEASEEHHNNELHISADIDVTSQDNQTANPIEICQGTKDENKLILHESADIDTDKAENLKDDVSQAVSEKTQLDKSEKSTYKQAGSEGSEEHHNNELHISTDIDVTSQDNQTANPIEICQGTKDENKLILHESADIDTDKAENLKDDVSQAVSEKTQLDKSEKSTYKQAGSEGSEEHHNNELHISTDIDVTSQDNQTANPIEICQGTKDENKLILHESADIDTDKAENLKDDLSQAVSEEKQLDKGEKSTYKQAGSEASEEHHNNELHISADIDVTSQDNQTANPIEICQGTKDENKLILHESADIDTDTAENLKDDLSQAVSEEKQLDKGEKSTYKQAGSEASEEHHNNELHISADIDDTSQDNQTANPIEICQGTKDENELILHESADIDTDKAENLKDDVSQAVSEEKQLDKGEKSTYKQAGSEASEEQHNNELHNSADIDVTSQDNQIANLIEICQGTKDENKLILHESADIDTDKAENLKDDLSQAVSKEKQLHKGEKSTYKQAGSEASEEHHNNELHISADIDNTPQDNKTANPIEICQGTKDENKLILHESADIDIDKAENLKDDLSQAVSEEKQLDKGEKSTYKQAGSEASEEHHKNELHISADIDVTSQDNQTVNPIEICQETKDENKLILHESADIDTDKVENLKDDLSQAVSKDKHLDKGEKSIHIKEALEATEEHHKNELNILKDITCFSTQDKQTDIAEKIGEICEIKDSPNTMAEDIRIARNLNEIGEGIPPMKICETDNNKGQYMDEVVLTSKESENEGENAQADIKQGRKIINTGSNENQMTENITVEKESGNKLSSFNNIDPSIRKSNEEETQLNQLNSVLYENNEKDLNDKTVVGIYEGKCPVSDNSLEKDLSRPCMAEICMESTSESFEIESGPIISTETIDYKENKIMVHQSETQSEMKEKESIYTEDFNNKLKENEPNMSLEHEKIQKQAIVVNENVVNQIEKDVSQLNADFIENVEKVNEPKEKIENIYKEPDILEKSETIVNNKDIPDSKLEKQQDQKLKTKVKKGKKVDKPEKKELKAQKDKIIPDNSEDPVGNQTDNNSKDITEENRDNNQNQYKDEQNLLTENESKQEQEQMIPQGDQHVIQSDKNDEHTQKDLLQKSYFETKPTSGNDANEEFKEQQPKIVIDENNRDQDLIKNYEAVTCTEDSHKIENNDSENNQYDERLSKKESHDKVDKEIGAINNTETVTKMLERELQENNLKQDLLTALDHEINNQLKDNVLFEEKQNKIITTNIIKTEEEGVNTLRGTNNQQNIIDERKRDEDFIQTDSEILSPFNKSKEYEILKSEEPSCAKYTSIEEDKELHEAVNVYQEPSEFKEAKKQTLAESSYLHSRSQYAYSGELQENIEEKIAASKDDNLGNSLACKTSISESKIGKHSNRELKQRPSYIDCSERDYELEFTRPSGYTSKPFDMDGSITEFQTYGKSPIMYKAQTLVHEAQLKSTVPPYDQRLNTSEGCTDLKQRTKTASEPRSTISEKRASFPRDYKRKPVFSTHLTDRTAVESSRVKLTCSILSSTDPTISWYKNGVLIDNKQKCRTKHVDGLITLEILNAVPSDSGEYSCTVQNENGSITSSANLKVYPGFEASPIPPTFTRSIRDVYHLHENELVLECRIRGQPLPTITWLKDNRPIILNERYQAHYLADGVCRLTINSPNDDDSGKYTCKAENSMWSDKITHDVQFTSKESRYIKNVARSENRLINRQATESRRPHFTNVLSDHKVVSGGTIGLQVEISGSPTRVEWLREGHSVIENYRNAQTYIDHGLYTLALPDVTEKESGLYTCRAWSTHGNVDMNASITVVQPNQFDGKPARIISRPVKDLLISVGEDLNISFRVQGEPKPKVFFIKGIRDITNSQRVCKMTSDDYVKFTLKRSVVSDAGTYCVFVRNAYGCDRAFVTVVIRQRASSDNLISDWTYPMDDLAISVGDRNYKSVPDRIPSEPNTVDGGNNWVSLAWPKPDSQAKTPILAYKVESWLLGKEGGARWTELGITPRNSFDAFNLKQGEEYHFRVTPRNRYGWGESVQTSTPIGIGLAGDRPEFVEILPGQLKVLVGETATLCCSFKGNPLPEIMWMKNGHEVEEEKNRVTIQLGGNNTSLQINNINIDDEGRYSCEATNIHGRSSTYSRMAVITDRQIWAADAKLKRERSAGANGDYPPQFTMRLRDRRVQATYPVRLTCQVIGSPSPIVTWFKNGEEVTLDSRHSTSQDEYFHTLEIAPTTLEDSGVYEAMARNGCGAISCRCNLVVDKGIRAYIAPEFCCGFEPLYRVCEGDELRISAVVEAYPSVGVTWYRDGVRLRTSRRAVMTLDRDGQIELALAAVAARDAGVYTCTASNEVGRASTSGKVEVIKGKSTSETPKVPPIVISPDVPYSKEPMFIRKPRSSEAREGDTVLLECEVIGDPKPDVYWLRDFLKPDYYRDASHFKRVGAGPAYRFEIPHAKLDYTGAYSIVAKNIHGEAKAIISLQILAKDPTCSHDTHNIRYGRVDIMPRFEKDLTDLLCYDGDDIEFECLVSGNPDPDIRWFHYTEVLPECSDFESSFELGTARLKIKQVTAEDEGTYTCEASNEMGKATSSACLVIYPPGEPNTLSQRLHRPPALLSACSTPRSTPRTTPVRSQSRTPGPDLRRLCSPSREIAPKFYTYPYNKVVEEGDTVVFQCAVRGLPPPWASWDKDGIIITPTARISVREKDDMFRILEIEQVTVEDVGLYRVTLENDYGRAEASARLEVISQKGKFYGSRSYSVSPRKCLPYRRRTPSLTRQD